MQTLTPPTSTAIPHVAADVRRRTQPGADVRRRTRPGDSPGKLRLLTSAATRAADIVNGPAPTPLILSKRQQEILRAACEGVPDKVIAGDLGVSPRTLEGHWRAIHQKLGTTNRCQAGFVFAALRENTRGKIPA